MPRNIHVHLALSKPKLNISKKKITLKSNNKIAGTAIRRQLFFSLSECGTVIHRIDRFVEFGTFENKRMRDQESAVLAEIRFVAFCFQSGFLDKFLTAEQVFQPVGGIAFERVGRLSGLFFQFTDQMPAGGAFQYIAFLGPPVHDGFFFQKGISASMGAVVFITGFHACTSVSFSRHAINLETSPISPPLRAA